MLEHFKTPNGRGLLAASFMALYFELVFIRWWPSAFHVLAFFGNVVLISAVLGLGLGMARQTETPPEKLWFRSWLCVILNSALVLLFSWMEVGVDYSNGGLALNTGLIKVNEFRANFYIVVGLHFGLTTLCFMPIGQLIGTYLARMPALAGYSIDILGSLLGIFCYTALTAMSLPPAVWIGVGLAIVMLARPDLGTRGRLLAVAGAALVGGAIFANERLQVRQKHLEVVWSPYYQIKCWHNKNGCLVHVNRNFLLMGLDLRPGGPEDYEQYRRLYNFPHLLFKPKSVLVLGAGAGNDVASALRNGAESVTAVEIDPKVLNFGKLYNPEKPYQDPRVHIVNNDARSYLRNTKEKFDLVIYGILDSHSLFSSMSSIKLENYVYTVESFRDALHVLNPNGAVYITYSAWVPWLKWRLYSTLEAAAQFEPILLEGDFGNAAILGKLPAGTQLTPDIHSMLPDFRKAQAEDPTVNLVPTDDRPHFYLREHKIPAEYQRIIGIILVMGTVMISRTGGLRRKGFPLDFFLLGAGFLLLETTCIASFGLLLGATWLTNALVISSILAMIFVANLILLRNENRVRLDLAFLGLGLSLVLLYMVDVKSLLVDNAAMRLTLAGILMGLPMLAAAVIFGTKFARHPNPREALAANMLGAVVGGLLENFSVVVGFHNLYLIAILLYLAAWGVHKIKD